METQNRNRKLVDDFPSGASVSPTITAAEAAGPSSKSSKDYYYNYPRPYLIPMSRSSSNGGNETSSNQPELSRLDSSMALTVVILLTVLFFMGFFSVYIHRLVVDDSSTDDNQRRRQQGRRGSSSSSSGLDSSVIQSLPLFAYDGNIKTKETLDCPICLSEFEEQEPIKLIPFCGHFFHPQCIDMWLSAHVSCPLCRSTQLLAPPPRRRDGKGGGGGMEEPVGGGCLSVCRTSTDVQSFVPTSINTECVECRRQREATAPPPLLDANATRVNSFSSLTSFIFEENREKVFGLPRPRSSTF